MVAGILFTCEAEIVISNSSVNDENHKNEIITFYERDDVSRQSPNVRDVIIASNNDTEYEVPIRHLYDSLRETYACFKELFPFVKCGFSKFKYMRPEHVHLRDEIPKNSCLCIHHEDFDAKLNALCKSQDNEQFLGYKNFVKNFICSDQNEECFLEKCQICGNGKLFKEALNILDNSEDNIKFLKWVKDSTTKRFTRVDINSTVNELIELIQNDTPKFKLHFYTKQMQQKSFQEHIQKATKLDSSFFFNSN